MFHTLISFREGGVENLLSHNFTLLRQTLKNNETSDQKMKMSIIATLLPACLNNPKLAYPGLTMLKAFELIAIESSMKKKIWRETTSTITGF